MLLDLHRWPTVAAQLCLIGLLSYISLSCAAQQAPVKRSLTSNSDSPAFALRQLQRCTGIRGTACFDYYLQIYDFLHQPPVVSKPCPINLNFHSQCGLGVCHGDTGICDCPAGVAGPDCGLADPRPCTNQYRSNSSISAAASHIGPNKRDIDWRQPGWTPSRCAGVCDDTTATCFCDGAHVGQVPALPGSPPGSAPIRPGRLLHGTCQRLTSDDRGRPLRWGNTNGVSYDDIYGAQGWCTVDTPRVRCSCDLDGYDGQLCDIVTETVCPNQCSGHGTCSRGFCKCFPGWFGLDCARLADIALLHAADVAAAIATPATELRAPAVATLGGAGATSMITAAAAAVAATTQGDLGGDIYQQTTADPDQTHNLAAAAAKLTAKAVPEHVGYSSQRPHLTQVVVDPWSPWLPHMPSANQANIYTHPPSSSAAARAAAAAARVSLQHRPAIPKIYWTPVDSAAPWTQYRSTQHAAGAGAAAGAGLPASDSLQGPQRISGDSEQQLSELPTAAAAAVSAEDDAHDDGAASAAVSGETVMDASHMRSAPGAAVQHAHARLHHTRGLMESAQHLQRLCSAAGHSPALEGLQQEPSQQLLRAAQQQQQQQQQQTVLQAWGLRSLRKLLHHFWTGGGSQRAELSIAPSQQTITAAVHSWLSALPADSTGSSSADDGGLSSIRPAEASSGSPHRPGSSAGSTGDAVGLEAALRAAKVRVEQLGTERDQALLLQMVERALGAVPRGRIRRPRIFVYDMPSRFVSRLLQYRSSKQTCSWRVFSKSNFSLFTTTDSRRSWRYPLESHLHELLLQSPHRTLDPLEADFFYVPVYAACMMEAVAGWADAPWWHTYSKSHVKQGVLMYQDALNWVRSTYPYWNASGGANHIWLFAHDEGACWAPSEIYNTSIILTQWGRLGGPAVIPGPASDYGPVMESWTSKWEQNWNKWHPSNDDPLGLPGRTYLELLSHHRCYTPGKDLVLPTFRPPTMLRGSPFLGGSGDGQVRDILFLLRGDMGKGRVRFSNGVRQKLARLAVAGDWKRRYGAWVGTPKELPGEQSVLLARSRFCLVAPLDGWSGTFEDAVLHGCIPVVVTIGDGIAQPFASLLHLSTGVLRVDEEDLPQLPDILKSIPPAQEEALRVALSSGWHRMAWLTHPFVRQQADKIVRGNLRKHPRVRYILEQQTAKQSRAFAEMGRAARPAMPTAEEEQGLLLPARPAAQMHGAGVEQDTSSALHDSAPTSSSNSSSDASEQLTAGAWSTANGSNSGISTPPPPPHEISEAQKVQELFRTHVWQLDAPLDDAFTTLMQWLHHKMLHPYIASSAVSHAAPSSLGSTEEHTTFLTAAEHTAAD